MRGVKTGAYGSDLARELADADLVFEAIAEDYDAKRDLFTAVDAALRPGTILATGTSGLSIAALCAGRSDGFRRAFVGVHLFNPPTKIAGCELIPHLETDLDVFVRVRELLVQLDREVVVTDDTPGFAGNRIGFKLLNEVAQLAEDHDPAVLDMLLGPHTGRALPPLATIDLVGWDVHRAIVDNLWTNTADEARATFVLPVFMQRGIAMGTLGRKTNAGFFRGKKSEGMSVLDPKTGDYRPYVAPVPPMFVERMKIAVREHRHDVAMDVLCSADGPEAELVRRVMLGYVSYALGRVGEVVEAARDVDRIMAFGFSWAPPSAIVDAIGPDRTIQLLERARLAVPDVVVKAAEAHQRLVAEPALHADNFFRAA